MSTDQIEPQRSSVDRLRDRHAAGLPSVGTFLHLPSPALVEICGLLGFDWIVLDAEHGPLDIQVLEHMARAANVVGVVTMARLPYPDPNLVNRLLDCGINGVLVPHLSTADLARSVVRSAKYSPIGRRGAGPNTRAARYGFGDGSAYVKQANSQTLVWGILEDVQALDNVESIVEVEGIDGFVIGHSDLSHGLSVPGEVSSSAVEDAIDRLAGAVLASGKMLCRVVRRSDSTMIEEAASYLDSGATQVAVGTTALLRSAAREFVALRSRARNT